MVLGKEAEFCLGPVECEVVKSRKQSRWMLREVVANVDGDPGPV